MAVDSIVAGLHSQHSHDERFQAVYRLKNAVIGCHAKKMLFVRHGVVPALVAMLADPACPPATKVQVAVVVGSFAHGSVHIVESLVNAGVIVPLLAALADSEPRLVEAAVRALRALFQHSVVPRDDVFEPSTNYYVHLVRLLVTTVNDAPHIAEMAAAVVARCCETLEQQRLLAEQSIFPALLAMLVSHYPKAQEAALDALGSLSRDNPSNARFLLGSNDDLSTIARLLRDKRSATRLAAATCLANLYRTSAMPQQMQAEMSSSVLPVLIKLFVDPIAAVREKAPLVLAYLVNDSEQMQKAAGEADAVHRLVQLLSSTSSSEVTSAGNDRLKENALLAIAAVCSLKEECRKQVIEAKILPSIVQAMEHSSVAIRIAACQCTRSLSRSVKTLRTALVDAGAAVPLLKLLSDSNLNVQIAASATLCNIVLDFSPMKKTVLENGGVEKLIQFISSMDSNLRLNAVWGLKNLLFSADNDVRNTVMKQLSYKTLADLLDDPDPAIQEQAVNLLRNLACSRESIEDVFNGIGTSQLVQILESKLDAMNAEILQQTLYVIVNISTGSEKHKRAIMENETILKSIMRYMSHNLASIRVASVWCVINLTWTEDLVSRESINRLRQLGFQTLLEKMVDDCDLEVRDRVKTAIQNFHAVSNNGGGGGASSSNSSGGGSGGGGAGTSSSADTSAQRC